MLRSNVAALCFLSLFPNICFSKSSILNALSQYCPMYVEQVSCTYQNTTHLIPVEICQFDSYHRSCPCISKHSVKDSSGIMHICMNHQGKKHIRKRQLENSRNCEGIQPPKPGKASCTISSGIVSCVGTCDDGYRFSDGSSDLLHTCDKIEGVWKPSSQYPTCTPVCDPPCENGGNCTEFDLCSCSNDYRGNLCQYPITLCRLFKNARPSAWQCNHTRTETTCDISCQPPGFQEALGHAKRFDCTMNGFWTPALPPCIAVFQCKEPAGIENGDYELVVGDTYGLGSRIRFYCNTGYFLRGMPNAVCGSDKTWIGGGDDLECIKDEDRSICEDPGEITNGRRTFEFPNFSVGAAVSYECRERFSMLGESQIYCQETGQWSSEKPRCIPGQNVTASCAEPNAPKNAVVHVSFPAQHPLRMLLNTNMSLSQKLFLINFQQSYSEASGVPKEVFVSGTRVQYECKSRFYKLYGSEYQTCLSSGTWSGYQPACVPDCGKSDAPRTAFVINGNSSRVGQWPWQVGLAVQGPDGHLEIICAAALISEEWLLTAAHCVTKKYTSVPVETTSVIAYCGKYHRSFEKDDEAVQVKRIRQIVVHPNYNFIQYDSDIALLQLDSSVNLTTRVQTICLPTEESTRDNIRDGKDGIVIGWGLKEDGRFSEDLKETTMPVVSHDRCEESYRKGLRTITVTENMFCAGHASGFSDTCNGDSGGPFMFAGPANNRVTRWILEGLVSWGSEAGCGQAGQYSGFTKVGQFVSWINMFI